MGSCGTCGYATPISSRFNLYLCTKTGKLKKGQDTCGASTKSQI